MTPLVSIIIPCYDAEPWIGAAIESALAQTWPAKEVIVINDGSRDRSLSVASGFTSRGVRVLDQANRGASAARNAGLSVARGEFIQFLDADDVLAHDKIARQINLAADPDIILSGTWGRFIDKSSNAKFGPEPLCADFRPIDWVVAKLEQHAMIHPAAWLASRRLIDRAGLWNEQLSLDDDGEFFTRLVLHSGGVRFCAEAVSYYRSNLTGSLSGRKSESACESAFRSLELSSDLLLRHENSPRTRHAVATAMQRFIYETYPQAPAARRRAAERVAAFGGSALPPPFGPKFQFARRLLGWRLARRLHRWIAGHKPHARVHTIG